MQNYLVRKVDTLGGFQEVYRFPNDYGVSFVNHSYSYGNEVAVVKFEGDNFEIDYTTPITDNVMCHLSIEEVETILEKVKEL